MERFFQTSAQCLRLPVLFLLLSLVPVAAQTPNTVSGHIGFAFPLVSYQRKRDYDARDSISDRVSGWNRLKGAGSLKFRS